MGLHLYECSVIDKPSNVNIYFTLLYFTLVIHLRIKFLLNARHYITIYLTIGPSGLEKTKTSKSPFSLR